MAAIVCHGLQSCLESQLVESRIHSLRLPSPKPLTPQPIDLAFKSCFWESNTKPHCEENSYKTDTVSSNPNQCSWSSIQALSNASQGPKEPTYVPPQVKLSWLRLSPKSLELCTENLGNETGTDITESGIDLLSSTDNAIAGGNLGAEDQRKPRQLLGAKKEKEIKSQNFPPPLTTMRGSESLRVRPHREGGRLVIEVTKVSSSSSSSVSCFQAERSHGRLRLSLWTDPEEEEEEEDGDNEDIDNQGFETEMNGHVEDEEEEQEAEEEVEEEGFGDVTENYEQNDEGGDAETKGNSWSIIGSEMRMEKYERVSRSRSRSSRCKEGGDHHENNELLLVVVNWGEPLWVATS